jgi:hypothetical protein
MYHLNASGPPAEDLVRARLSHEFPHVPTRIINAVFTAYRAVTASLPEAALATHARLQDARATETVDAGCVTS